MIRALSWLCIIVGTLGLGVLAKPAPSASTRQHAPCAVARGTKETARFRRLTGYPSGRPGYVVDHIIPLCACGVDSVVNLQWMRQDSSYVKDTWERQMCAALVRDTLR